MITIKKGIREKRFNYKKNSLTQKSIHHNYNYIKGKKIAPAISK